MVRLIDLGLIWLLKDMLKFMAKTIVTLFLLLQRCLCLFLSTAAMHSWPLFQLDIENVFLHGELQEEIYMEQPPDFIAQGEPSLVCKLR